MMRKIFLLLVSVLCFSAARAARDTLVAPMTYTNTRDGFRRDDPWSGKIVNKPHFQRMQMDYNRPFDTRQITTAFFTNPVETHVFTTYDTTIIYWYDPYHSFTYTLRISRPTNLFTAGNADTASRPALFMMPGQGEMSADTSKLTVYGPHYWLKSGWDGSIVLGNGTHYPILITMICNVNPPEPPIAGNFWVMDYMIKHYHIKRNGVHLTGLSEGAFTWSGMIGLTDTTGTSQTGADIGMREVTSICMLSGAATSSGNFTEFGHWAKAWNGKAFLTVGYQDAQTPNPPQVEQAMNDSVKGSAYFTYNTVDGGQHGGWNTEYDPSQTNWQSFAPLGPYITTSTDTNSRGTYWNGQSIMQWMFSQGDTSIVGSTPLTVKKEVEMEYWNVNWCSNDTLYGTVNASTYPIAMPLPNGETVRDAFGAFNQVEAVSSAGKVYSSSTYNFGSNTWTQISTDTSNAAITNAIGIRCYQNTWAIIRSDSSIWMGGGDFYLLYHTTGSVVMRPTLLSNAAKFVKVVMGAYYVAATTTTGTVYVWHYGQVGLTPTIYTLGANALDIATGGYTSILVIVKNADSTDGKLYALGSSWGTWGATTAATYTTFTDISSLWTGGPWTKISMTTNATHAINASGALYGAGYNPQGEVGNGQEFVDRYTYPNWRHYGWDFVDYENPVAPPQTIAPGIVFTDIWDNEFFTFYKTAKDVNGNIYSWGRNKNAVCQNGLFTGFTFNQSDPNLLDILVPTIVNPLTSPQTTINPTLPTAPISGNINTTTNTGTITLTGAPLSLINASTSASLGYTYTSVVPTQLSGPNTLTLGTGTTFSYSNAITGVYGIHVATTDSKGALDTGYVTLTVTISANTPPTVSAGGPYSAITLPTNTMTLVGTAAGTNGASITSVLWTQVSGPGTAGITSASSLTTTVTGLIAGVYTFQLKATDNRGSTNTSTASVTVNSSSGNYLTLPIRVTF